jgi:hypothetical protein
VRIDGTLKPSLGSVLFWFPFFLAAPPRRCAKASYVSPMPVRVRPNAPNRRMSRFETEQTSVFAQRRGGAAKWRRDGVGYSSRTLTARVMPSFMSASLKLST